MRKAALCLLLLLFVISAASSEDTTQEATERLSPESGLVPLLSDKNMLLLSMSTKEYPVTPGDIYKISYLSADHPISHEVIVGSDFTINLNVLGKLNGRDLTFVDFKRIIEKRIVQGYPDSTPSVIILTNGRFQVYIKGEVDTADYITVWGLSRLSQVIKGRLTPYSSIRDIKLVSQGGATKEYDLFKARRFGEKEQDPYLRPGDTVVIGKRDREVRISGAVRRPGSYQLLPHEGIEELVERYGDGFTELADRSRVKLDRLVTDGKKIAESVGLDLSQGYDEELALNDLDHIFVPEKTKRLPVLYIEGAVDPGLATGKETTPVSEEYQRTNKITVTFKPGTTLYDLMWAYKNALNPAADLQNSLIVRNGRQEIITVDLGRLLYEYAPRYDLELQPFDRVIVPYRQFFVTVTGAVHNPGPYPYVPEKTYMHYINLAGGTDPERGNPRRVSVFDRNNETVPKQSILEPESSIHVPYAFSYYFVKYFPIITSSISAILSILIAAGLFQ